MCALYIHIGLYFVSLIPDVFYGSLLKTLERYQRYIYSSADAAVPSSDEMQVLVLQDFIIDSTTTTIFIIFPPS